MDEKKQGDQLEPTYSSFVPLRDIALKTSGGRWTIGMGGESGSERSVLAVWHDDDETYVCCKKTKAVKIRINEQEKLFLIIILGPPTRFAYVI